MFPDASPDMVPGMTVARASPAENPLRCLQLPGMICCLVSAVAKYDLLLGDFWLRVFCPTDARCRSGPALGLASGSQLTLKVRLLELQT